MGDSGPQQNRLLKLMAPLQYNNRNTNISDWLEQTITRQLLFTEYKAEKKKVGSVPIIKASTNVEQQKRLILRTNTRT